MKQVGVETLRKEFAKTGKIHYSDRKHDDVIGDYRMIRCGACVAISSGQHLTNLEKLLKL